MSGINTNGKRLFIARHGETIFNLAGRIQGEHIHTPLTRAGFAQADAMGRALASHLSPDILALDLIASDTDRALQTLSVVAEHVGELLLALLALLAGGADDVYRRAELLLAGARGLLESQVLKKRFKTTDTQREKRVAHKSG